MKRKPFQFSLLGLLGLMTAVALWIAAWMWLPPEFRLFAVVPIVVVIGIVAAGFAWGFVAWLVIWVLDRLFRKQRSPHDESSKPFGAQSESP